MTKTLAITKLNTNSLKVEEIEALKEIADLLPDGTYLKSLFSTKLVEWAEQNILNDFPPDIMEAYTFSQKETEAAEIQNMLRQHETEVMQLKARLYDLMTAKK
jgi:hypothetical protein